MSRPTVWLPLVSRANVDVGEAIGVKLPRIGAEKRCERAGGGHVDVATAVIVARLHPGPQAVGHVHTGIDRRPAARCTDNINSVREGSVWLMSSTWLPLPTGTFVEPSVIAAVPERWGKIGVRHRRDAAGQHRRRVAEIDGQSAFAQGSGDSAGHVGGYHQRTGADDRGAAVHVRAREPASKLEHERTGAILHQRAAGQRAVRVATHRQPGISDRYIEGRIRIGCIRVADDKQSIGKAPLRRSCIAPVRVESEVGAEIRGIDYQIARGRWGSERENDLAPSKRSSSARRH